MKNTAFLFLFFLGLVSCADTPKDADVPPTSTDAPQVMSLGGSGGIGLNDTSIKQVRGLLTFNNKTGIFFDFAHKAMFKIGDNTKTLEETFNKTVAPCHYPSEAVFAVLSGKASVAASANSIRTFTVYKIDTMQAKSPENLTSLGIPFEFWCHGTEPFWDIQICNIEGGIFYQNNSDGSAWFCPWVPPVIKDNTFIYTIPEQPGVTGAITLKIKKEKASDGMSDKSYDYSAEITVKGSTFHGVAIKGTGKVMGPNGKE